MLQARPLNSRQRPLQTLLCAAALTLAACGDSDDDSSGGDVGPGGPGGLGGSGAPPFGGDGTSGTLAFVAGATPDFQTGQIERFEVREMIVSTGLTPATLSDIDVATDGTDVYEIGRFNLDSLTRFRADALETPVWQYSVNGGEVGSNPYEIVFADENKAYVTRYGSGQIWIVDPAATREADFLLGRIDLSAYDTDGVPEMSDAVLIDDRLFVLLERLDNFTPTRNAYLAVIDTRTDTEIDTGQGNDGLPGIALQTRNPTALHYVEATDELTLVGRGNFFRSEAVTDDPFSGGVEVVDAETYANDLLIDDGTEGENLGFFVDALVVSPTRAYLLTYATFGDTTLRSYDPRTGVLDPTPVAGLENVDIGVLALDPAGRVWVGLNDDAAPGFRLLDPSDDRVLVERVPTRLNPSGIVFVEPN